MYGTFVSSFPMKAPIKHAPTLFLKAVILLMGVAVLALCVFFLPQVWVMVLRELPEFKSLAYPALIGFSATALPFFFALYQALKLLHFIDRNNAFSQRSVNALRLIKYCAIAMSILYAMALPLLFVIAELDDAPGLGGIGLIIASAPMVVATFAAVLQKLVRSAVDMKAEQELTI